MSISKQTVKWLNANCHTSIKGKTVLVTGANSGVGFKTAEIAAYLGANVILACRSPEILFPSPSTFQMKIQRPRVKCG